MSGWVELARTASSYSVRATLVATLLLLLLAAPGALKAWRRQALSERVAWGSILLGAILLRLLAAEPTLVNENHHGEMFLRALLQDRHFDTYGPGWMEFFRPIAHLFGTPAVLTVNAILGGIACVLSGLAARVVLGAGRSGALATAILLALLPVHIRVSHSETFFVLGTFWGTLAFVLAGWSLLRGDRRVWWIAWLSAAVAAQVRPEYFLYLPLLGVLPLVVKGPGSGWQRLFAPAVAGVLLLPRAALILLIEALPGKGPSSLLSFGDALRAFPTDAHLVLNPGLFPLLLTGLSLFGLGVLLLIRPRAALWAATLITLLAMWSLGVEPNLGNILRYQHAGLFLWVMLAGTGVGWILDRSGGLLVRAVSLAVVVALLSSGWMRSAKLLTWSFNKDEQYRYQRTFARHLPEEGVLVIADHRMGKGRIVADFDPGLLPNGGRDWRLLRFSQLDAVDPEFIRLGTFVYFRGTWSYEFASDELPEHDPTTPRPAPNPFFHHEITSPGNRFQHSTVDHRIRPRVERFERRFRLEPLDAIPEHTFDNRPYERWVVPQRHLTIGFHRLRPLEDPRPAPRLSPAFAALLEPLQPGDKLVDGWFLGTPHADGDAVIVPLLHTTALARVGWRLTAREHADDPDEVTASFALARVADPDIPQEWGEDALGQLAEGIRSRDPGGLRLEVAWLPADPLAATGE